MVYGLWSMVYGLWSMVYGLWSMVLGLWSIGGGASPAVEGEAQGPGLVLVVDVGDELDGDGVEDHFHGLVGEEDEAEVEGVADAVDEELPEEVGLHEGEEPGVADAERGGGAELGEAGVGGPAVDAALDGAHGDEGGDGGHEELGPEAGVAKAISLDAFPLGFDEPEMAQKHDLDQDRSHGAEPQEGGEELGLAGPVGGHKSEATIPGSLLEIIGANIRLWFTRALWISPTATQVENLTKRKKS